MTITLAVDMVILTILISQLMWIVWINKQAYKDPTYCMFRPTSFLYSIAAGFSGFTYSGKLYLLISLPILVIALVATYYFGLMLTFYFITISQAVCLTIVVVFRKLNLVRVCG